MSAAEVIDLIRKLPPKEQAEVVAFFKNGGFNPAAAEVDFERAAKRVFADNHDLLRRLAQ